MWNDCVKKHNLWSESCTGNLCWDTTHEYQWGICWREALTCEKCHFVSPLYKLYHEVESDKPGQKDAAPNNRALQVGLSHTGISNTGMRTILMTIGIPAPSASGMQKQCNKISDKILELNQKDMKNIRTDLMDLNEMRGLPRCAPLTVQGDGRFNNSLASGTGS